MTVRVISGTARGRRLAVPDATDLRPTSDRARETLFNVLAPRVVGARFLDTFAGSGAIGIEALSRGAAAAVFVERSRRVAHTLRANVELCGFSERATVLAEPWDAALRRLAGDGHRFDIAFFDPPWAWEDAHTCLARLLAGEMLVADGIAVIEHRGAHPPAAVDGWHLERRLDVGDTSFSLFGIIPPP